MEYPGFVLDDNENVVQIVKKACQKLGINSETVSSGGGSDTNIYNSKGVPCVNLAVGMSKVHTLEEYIEINDLVNLSKILVEIIKG
ncbi:MAG: M20/M25/M40 family metallo-hydrolase [Cetobacterium sp.]